MKPIDRDLALSVLEESMVSLHRAYASVSGSTCHDEEDCFWYESSIGHGVYGGVFLQRFTSESVDKRVEEVEMEMSSGYGWMVLPTSTPPDLGERIVATGGKEVIELKGMAMWLSDLEPASPCPGLEIVPAIDEGPVREYARLYPLIFGDLTADVLGRVADAEIEILTSGRDEFHRYLALENDTFVGAGMTSRHGDACSLETLLTLPEARNRGIGRALATQALLDERDAGADLAVLWAGPGADPLYSRMGFQHVGVAKGYMFGRY